MRTLLLGCLILTSRTLTQWNYTSWTLTPRDGEWEDLLHSPYCSSSLFVVKKFYTAVQLSWGSNYCDAINCILWKPFSLSFLPCPFAVWIFGNLLLLIVFPFCIIVWNLLVSITNLFHWLGGGAELSCPCSLLNSHFYNLLLSLNMTGVGTLCLSNG